MEGKHIAIFDLDGTIAIIEHRIHFLTAEWRDWDRFHAACTHDSPNKPVIDILNELYGQYEIWIVSGRSNAVHIETTRWLEDNGVNYDHIIMRKADDHTDDDKLKRLWLIGDDETKPLIPKDRVAFVFEDRDRCVKMYREEGITCFQVREGNF